jgi:hypothetical protein
MNAIEKLLVGALVVVVVGTGVSYVLWKTFVHRLGQTVIIPAYSWHVSGHVLDIATNSIAGVSVTLVAIPRMTAADRLAERGAAPLIITTNTDNNGGFVFDFQAAGFQVKVSKPGYAEQTLDFGPYVKGPPPTNTNPVLQVYLEAAQR